MIQQRDSEENFTEGKNDVTRTVLAIKHTFIRLLVSEMNNKILELKHIFFSLKIALIREFILSKTRYNNM